MRLKHLLMQLVVDVVGAQAHRDALVEVSAHMVVDAVDETDARAIALHADEDWHDLLTLSFALNQS